ncbi:MAG TPA: hypothetical protein VJR02_14780, partial [Pyrinomonadaceae bacterium]|nr:hypothetical protein [Pyrinomonadaceae bacterium]
RCCASIRVEFLHSYPTLPRYGTDLFQAKLLRQSAGKEKSAAVFAVRRANYTHRRKGVFNA